MHDADYRVKLWFGISINKSITLLFTSHFPFKQWNLLARHLVFYFILYIISRDLYNFFFFFSFSVRREHKLTLYLSTFRTLLLYFALVFEKKTRILLRFIYILLHAHPQRSVMCIQWYCNKCLHSMKRTIFKKLW